MNAPQEIVLIRQHLIDPEVCIRCNTCEETCPIDAITHDGRNYVVDAARCNSCNECIAPCPTGSIDHWRTVARQDAYSLENQFSWDSLPEQQEIPEGSMAPVPPVAADGADASVPLQVNATVALTSAHAPWSAAHPYLNLYTPRKPVTATVAGNLRLTAASVQSDIRHIVLDFGQQFFPVLEGQSIGILPPGTDAAGKPHFPRMYSVASPRDGERPGYNNLSLTVKRVLEDHAGKPVRGVGSNFLCDLQKGDQVAVIGPFGNNFLMPNHPGSNLLMVCTGTGSAPMRAMTEQRRRQVSAGQMSDARLMLFFGARQPDELPYFGPLARLPANFLDKHFAFSRVPGEPRTHVQDRIRAAGAQVVQLLRADTCVYICGLKGMEAGVLEALHEVCQAVGLDWPALHAAMIAEGRFHVETY